MSSQHLSEMAHRISELILVHHHQHHHHKSGISLETGHGKIKQALVPLGFFTKRQYLGLKKNSPNHWQSSPVLPGSELALFFGLVIVHSSQEPHYLVPPCWRCEASWDYTKKWRETLQVTPGSRALMISPAYTEDALSAVAKQIKLSSFFKTQKSDVHCVFKENLKLISEPACCVQSQRKAPMSPWTGD